MFSFLDLTIEVESLSPMHEPPTHLALASRRSRGFGTWTVGVLLGHESSHSVEILVSTRIVIVLLVTWALSRHHN